jgi:hypothetical protein
MGISVQKQVKDYQLPRRKDALQGRPACFLHKLGNTPRPMFEHQQPAIRVERLQKGAKNNFYSS